jgi:hypothetical protein
MGKRIQHKTNRSKWNLFALIFVLLIGCSQVNDLPLTPEVAFNVPEVPSQCADVYANIRCWSNDERRDEGG